MYIYVYMCVYIYTQKIYRQNIYTQYIHKIYIHKKYTYIYIYTHKKLLKFHSN